MEDIRFVITGAAKRRILGLRDSAKGMNKKIGPIRLSGKSARFCGVARKERSDEAVIFWTSGTDNGRPFSAPPSSSPVRKPSSQDPTRHSVPPAHHSITSLSVPRQMKQEPRVRQRKYLYVQFHFSIKGFPTCYCGPIEWFTGLSLRCGQLRAARFRLAVALAYRPITSIMHCCRTLHTKPF